jgi:hypothetical protein
MTIKLVATILLLSFGLFAKEKDAVQIQVIDSTPGTVQVPSLDGSRLYTFPTVTLRAVLPDGSHFLLWCAKQYRDCADLTAGTYAGEVDGDKAVKLYVYGPLSHKFVGKIKYRLVGTW